MPSSRACKFVMGCNQAAERPAPPSALARQQPGCLNAALLLPWAGAWVAHAVAVGVPHAAWLEWRRFAVMVTLLRLLLLLLLGRRSHGGEVHRLPLEVRTASPDPEVLRTLLKCDVLTG
jgi:hypothetical protein